MKHILSLLVLICISINMSAQDKNYKVRVTTMFGDMIIKLYDDTPIHRDNFVKNVKSGMYDGTMFHRILPAFMAQGGNPKSIGAGPNESLSNDNCGVLPAEIRANHFHKKGAVASARLPDANNPNKESSACQFYIAQGYKWTDTKLDELENANYKFPDVNRAYYKTVGGYPYLDMRYTVFGEVTEGLEIIDLMAAMPTGALVQDRPNTDIIMKMTMVQ